MQSGIAPCPGSTTRVALRITSGSSVTTIGRVGRDVHRAPWRPSAGCPCRSRRPRRRHQAEQARSGEQASDNDRAHLFAYLLADR